ncbi:hypothetical protein FACS1894187_02720 [Synergistales bacterium]|nr:hypothetical protein FACS1894187_02720 [Synergistales bacterium]
MKNVARNIIGKFISAIFVFILSASVLSFAAFAEALGVDEQRALALSLRFSVSHISSDAASETAKEKESLYMRIIEECPDTPEAEEAYWELSDLYLDGFDEPKEKEAKAILERFLKKYDAGELSASPWVMHVKSRLKWLQDEVEK